MGFLTTDWKRSSVPAVLRDIGQPRAAVHVWRCYLPDLAGQRIQLAALLSAAESVRRDSFVRSALQDAFALRRGILRQVLGIYEGVAPNRLAITETTHGKPVLEGNGKLHFNSSHTADWTVIAISRAGPVGIDIEICTDTPANEAIVETSFGSSERGFLAKRSGAAWSEAFYRVWTCKEAVLKAEGTGLIDNLSGLTVEPDPAHRPHVVNTRDPKLKRWQLTAFELCQNGTGVLAHPDRAHHIHFFHLTSPGH